MVAPGSDATGESKSQASSVAVARHDEKLLIYKWMSPIPRGGVGAGGLRPPATRFAGFMLLQDAVVYLMLEHNSPEWKAGCLLHDFLFVK